ncbi:hypothetical protein GF356_00300 [candidate division GN15 bacterium]|nr:hypothetical protein [candidate division GN15 bacterium]
MSNITRILLISISCWILLAALGGPSASAQFYFGKNKVQYTSFEWQMMETEHFRVYFYEREENIAHMAGQLAEDAYDVLAPRFRHEVLEKIPLIIYSTPTYFSQTNIIPGLLPESVGGFTEFMKGRVVVPFHGSYEDFRHVIQHELVHVFMLSRLEEAVDRHGRSRWDMPPLWFVEGLAEFWSKDFDTDADMFIEDMVLNDRLPTIEQFYTVRGTYFMYKLGHSVCHFIDSAYGPDKLALIFDNWTKAKNFNEVVELTLGVDLRELSRKWVYSVKKRYYPNLEERDLPDMESEQLTHDGFCVRGVPITWDDGDGPEDWVVFKANRLGYTGIYMKRARGSDRDWKTLVKGERDASFESMYLIRSGIDANDSGLIVFSSRAKDRDVVYMYDLNHGRVTHRFDSDSLVTIQSPRLSPDSRQVVFTGMTKAGPADLYLLDIQTGHLNRLTDDIYYDVDAAFTTDGRRVVFTSDRGPDGISGAMNLFEYDPGTQTISQLTFGDHLDSSPDATEHGIYFTSDRDGSFNIYLLDSTGQLTRQSTYVTGAFDPRLSTDGSRVVFTGFQKMRYQIYQMTLPEKPEPVEQQPQLFATGWKPRLIEGDYRSSTISYDSDYSLDIAQSMIGYDPVYGSIGGLQVAISDMLGNQAWHFLLTNTASDKDEFLESFNLGITYINRESRLNWGVGAYHLYDEYYNDFDSYYYERQAGVLSLLSYPISKFHRVDLTTLARYSKRDRYFGIQQREAFLASHYLSWVYDNSIWDISGPIEGRRYNLTVGVTTDVGEMENFNRTLLADIRHYFRLGKASAFANRLFGYHSSGTEPQRIYFGGSWSFRGYDRREFYNRNILFASNELRFPLIDQLYIGSPVAAMGFSAIRGALFFDVGSAWDDEFNEWLGSYGFGFRVALGYLVLLRFDFTRTTDFDTTDPHTDFDFFFGWNF